MAKTKTVAKTKKAARRTSAKKTAAKTKLLAKNHSSTFLPGTYVVPRGNVSIAVPTFWTLRQTNEDLELDAPTGDTSIVVNAYQRNDNYRSLDARDYLKHFLETAPHAGRVSVLEGSKTKSAARFRDAEGNHWHVVFVSNGNTLLLATCSTPGPLTGKQARTAIGVLNSLRMKKK
ncbi:MAG TPA: hypothetical protein VMT82_08350 [candidate division Zixibacteria bacterium]|nr:hypothetical protein [candidate division Zixibacteria bacterium]